MSSIKGMGSCAITQENGYPCGRQILEGEPIGTVAINGQPYVGHKTCADKFNFRKTQEKPVVQIGSQNGPAGAVGPFKQGLVDDGRPSQATVALQTAGARLPDGVELMSDVPMDEYDGPTPNPGQTPPLALTAAEQKVLEEFRKTQKPKPHVVTLDLSKLPANADLHIHIKR